MNKIMYLCFAVSILLGMSVVSADLVGKTICLDPGHGGTDPGAVNGLLLEKEINLDVANILRDMLLSDGASSVVLTRETNDVGLGNSDRAYICNDAGADVLISIHTNSVADPFYDGSYMYWFKSSDRVLANIMQPIMYSSLMYYDGMVDPFIDFGTDRFASGTLMRSTMPAVITESVFMSNAQEAEWLSSTGSARRVQIAQSHFDGIVEYFDTPVDPEPHPGKKK